MMTAGEFKPMDYGFDIAFGLGSPLDPTIGNYQVNQVIYYFLDQYDENNN